MQRYDDFDGIEWTQQEPQSEHGAANRPLVRQELDERAWYFRQWSMSSKRSPLLGPARGDAVKFINLRSPRIPAPATAAGVHIADVDRDDFFAISADDSFLMSGRSHVPSLTVVRLVTHEVDADGLHAIGALPWQEATQEFSMESTAGIQMAQRLAQQWSEGATSDWQRVEKIVDTLRSEFEFDRAAEHEGEDPLASFLTLRRGGDHLFATAAAVMLRSLGLQARLATGFYVPVDRYDALAGHAELLADDVHVWVELQADGDLWLPLEPTPGFAPPRFYRPFWKRAVTASWAAAPWALLLLLSGLLAWRSRRVWGDWACRALWRMSWPLAERRRLVLLVRLLDVRSRLAGAVRPAGVTPRRWAQRATGTADASLQLAAERLFDLADAMFYDPQGQEPLPKAWLRDAEQIASGLTVQRWIEIRTLQMSNS